MGFVYLSKPKPKEKHYRHAECECCIVNDDSASIVLNCTVLSLDTVSDADFFEAVKTGKCLMKYTLKST